MRISWSCIQQGVLLKAKIDTKFRRTLEKQGKPFLPDVRTMSDEELVAKLSSLSIVMNRDKLRSLAKKRFSVENIVLSMEADGLVLKGPEQQWAWLSIVVLWERWLPETPCFETLDDWMQEGYIRSMAQNHVGACTIWLEVWRHLLRLADERELRTLDEMEEIFPGTQCFFNWVQDLELEFRNAGAEDKSFHEVRVDYCQAYLERFTLSDKLITQNTRRAMAEAHFILGHRKMAEGLFDKWLKADPQWGFGWIEWSDCWSDWGKDNDKAKTILMRGHSVYNVKNREEIEGRLEHLGVEIKKKAPPSTAKLFRCGKKVGRNDLCPCGSGKKFKRCCLRKG